MHCSSSSHRPLLAAAVVAQPALLGVNALFHPDVELTASSFLTAALDGPATWYAVHAVAALGALLLAPAAVGLGALVHDRGRRLAVAGMTAAFAAAALLAMGFAIEASVLRLSATAAVDRGAALAIVDAYTESLEFFLVPLGAIAATLASVLLAAALLRARAVARWQAQVYLVGAVGTAAAAPGTLVGPLSFALMTLGAMFLAVRVMSPSADLAPQGAVAETAKVVAA